MDTFCQLSLRGLSSYEPCDHWSFLDKTLAEQSETNKVLATDHTKLPIFKSVSILKECRTQYNNNILATLLLKVCSQQLLKCSQLPVLLQRCTSAHSPMLSYKDRSTRRVYGTTVFVAVFQHRRATVLLHHGQSKLNKQVRLLQTANIKPLGIGLAVG